MDIDYPVVMSMVLEPVGCPQVKVTAGPRVFSEQISASTKIHFEFRAHSSFDLTVELRNKDALDPTTAVQIKNLEIFGIGHDKFLWAGAYYPNYPDHLADQPSVIPSQTYLSWNGYYRLTIAVPVFVWIHQTLNMGWLYR